MFNVAVLSRWHPHEGRYTPELLASPDCRVTCVWDEVPDRGLAWAEEINVPFVQNVEDIWENPDIDGVVITAPTVMHRELIVAAANAGKHVFVEKSLALTAEDALAIKEAVEKSNVKFTIAYIRCTTGPFMFAKRVFDSGLLGDATMLRIRNGHNQALNGVLPDYWFNADQTGGGAMTDLGCHQIYLMDWMLGLPESVNSTFGYYTGKAVDDSGACMLTYAGGKTVGIFDSSFTTFYSPYTFEIYGTKGTVLVRLDQPGVEVHLDTGVEPWFEAEYGDKVEKTVYGERTKYVISNQALPDDPSPLRSWVNACSLGDEIKFGIDSAVRMTRVIEAMNRSWAEKTTIKL